ncbi:MAG: UDP-3-O-acyl-N-acetylglucosamine deacetylase [Candidatus Sericytochromatia bacterium]|nr:UDP-3-O-acyl-N-acetylglucosamine deacetylase [Candidatus Sericytochromatia bacterium]
MSPAPFDPVSPGAPWGRRWTLAAPVAFEGTGLHTGARVAMRIEPAQVACGIHFSRVDLPGEPTVPALTARVATTRLATTLVAGQAAVATTEHLMAALWGLGISDAFIRLEGPEVPMLDGSALPFVNAIREVGVIALSAPRPVRDFTAQGVGEGQSALSVVPHPETVLTVAIDYGRPPLRPTLFHFVFSPALFASQLAPARTFALEEDLPFLREAGLIRGASLDGGILVGRDGFSSPLRFPDEMARHKALDLLGDLALLGVWWRGHVVAVKAGHTLHHRLASLLDSPPTAREDAT